MLDWHEIPSINLHERVREHCKGYIAHLGDDTYVKVLVGKEPAAKDGKLIWHLSASYETSNPSMIGMPPALFLLREARYKFIPDNVNMGIVFPRQELQYNAGSVIQMWELQEFEY